MSGRQDQLFECVQVICRQYGMPSVDPALLPTILGPHKKLDPQMAIMLLNRVGFEATLTRVSEQDIMALKQADMVILQDNQAGVILGVHEDGNIRLAKATNEADELIDIRDFMKMFTGFIFNVRKVDQVRKGMYAQLGTDQNWFSASLSRITHTYPHLFVATILINVFSFVVPLYIMNVYDRAVPTGAMDTLIAFTVGASLMMVFDYILRTLRGSLMNRITAQIDQEMSKGLFHQILNFKLNAHQITPGDYMETSREIREMRKFFADTTLTTVIDLPFTILFVLGVYIIAGNLVWVLIGAIAFILSVNVLLQPMVNQSQRSMSHYSSLVQNLTLEVYSGIETVKTLAAEAAFARKYDLANGVVKEPERYRMLSNSVSQLNAFIKSMTSICLVFFGSLMIFSLELTLGKLVAAVMIGSRAMMVDQLSSILSKMSRMQDAVQHLNEFMSLAKEYDGSKSYIAKSNLSGQITVQNISYAYPDAPNDIINDISIEFKAGEHIAVVGPVGAGKSTFAKCLVNMLSLKSGYIMYDGTDHTEIDPILLRQQVHLMNRDNHLFEGSVIENIRLANPRAQMQDVMHAIQNSGVINFIRQHPLGLDMPVEDNGNNLSSGQKQAIAIARCLVSPAKVLILDEPTSFIDVEMSAKFLSSLVRSCKDKTILFITHRIPLCQFMDRVIEVRNGKITKDGPAKEMVKKIVSESQVLSYKQSGLME